MTLGDSIRRGALWLFVGNTGSQVLTFAFGIVLARLLAPEDFGMLVTIQVFTGLAGFVAGGGMGQGLVRAPEVTQGHIDVVFTLQLAIGCAIYALFYAAAPWFAQWYDMPLYASLLRVSALTFVIRPFVNLPGSILHRDMRFKAQTVVRIATLLVSSAVSIGMAWHGYGVWSLILGGLTGSLCSMALLMHFTRWRPALSLDVARARGVARYGMLVSLNDIVAYLRNQGTNFVLGKTLGPAAVGLFNKGDSLARMPQALVTASVYQVLFRALAQEQDNLDKSRYLFFRSLSLVAVYVTPFYVGAFWLADSLVTVLYGVKWAEAAAPLAMIAIAGPFLTVANLSGAVLAARNWLERELVVQAVLLVMILLATLTALPYGLPGVSIAVLLVSIYNALHMYVLASRCLKASWGALFAALQPAVVLNAILIGMLTAVQHFTGEIAQKSQVIYLMLTATVGGLVYGLCFLYLPIDALRTEQLRWKARLRLARKPSTT
ncbi:lipopolysaccharide biosynthesis protein [Azoarcus sp. KH32C]|uniref:lipopolysaccharide biosynthesis protein n=1 Tax=Azoarcus sp. KH32C TaxID=748247 RepID=UPI0002386885|nr:lipopolysaccharide biosynthesis protein [Azoarcus sp. KH32C]BAL25877.1 lipopolysaccharide biosynthesis protein [Azoarcus sp. KH32C]